MSAVDQLIDGGWWHADTLGEAILADAHGAEERLQENLAGVAGRKLRGHALLPQGLGLKRGRTAFGALLQWRVSANATSR